MWGSESGVRYIACPLFGSPGLFRRAAVRQASGVAGGQHATAERPPWGGECPKKDGRDHRLRPRENIEQSQQSAHHRISRQRSTGQSSLPLRCLPTPLGVRHIASHLSTTIGSLRAILGQTPQPKSRPKVQSASASKIGHLRERAKSGLHQQSSNHRRIDMTKKPKPHKRPTDAVSG